MKKEIKKHLPSLIILLTPLIFIIGSVIYLSLTSQTVTAESDFLFTNNYDYGFVVEDSQLKATKNREQLEERRDQDINLWRYSIEDESVKKLSFEEAKKLRLSDDDTSPDGYEIETRSCDFDLFPSSGKGVYIYNPQTKASKKLNLNWDDLKIYDWPNVGWIVDN